MLFNSKLKMRKYKKYQVGLLYYDKYNKKWLQTKGFKP